MTHHVAVVRATENREFERFAAVSAGAWARRWG